MFLFRKKIEYMNKTYKEHLFKNIGQLPPPKKSIKLNWAKIPEKKFKKKILS